MSNCPKEYESADGYHVECIESWSECHMKCYDKEERIGKYLYLFPGTFEEFYGKIIWCDTKYGDEYEGNESREDIQLLEMSENKERFLIDVFQIEIHTCVNDSYEKREDPEGSSVRGKCVFLCKRYYRCDRESENEIKKRNSPKIS